jgi:hypothetical protein
LADSINNSALPYAVHRAADYCPEVSIENLNRRIGYASYVSLERRYLYYQVSKAGCTSMKWMLHDLEHLPPINYFVGWQRESRRDMFIHERSNLKIKSLLDLDDETQEFVLNSPDFFRFTVVRNPYFRIESAWKDKVRLCAPTYEHLYRAIKGRLPEGTDPSSMISFPEFVAAISREDLANCDAHWRSQSVQLLRGALNLTHIGRLENFQGTIEKFRSHLKIEKIEQRGYINRTAWISYYDENLARSIFRLYRADFETFDYPQESWIRPTVDDGDHATVPENVFVDEVLERNIVIGHLYDERETLRKRIQELEAALRKAAVARTQADPTVEKPSGEANVTEGNSGSSENLLISKRDILIRQANAALAERPYQTGFFYQLAKYYRENQMNAASALVCEMGIKLLCESTDEPSFYRNANLFGLMEQYSIAANYSKDDARKARGHLACNFLALSRNAAAPARNLARHNLQFYVEPIKAIIPSFAAERVGFTPPDGYHAMNSSIARSKDRLVMSVRCVNYTLTGEGQYRVPGGALPHTRSYLLQLGADLSTQSAMEMLPPDDMPPMAAGRLQDPRLFAWRDCLWCSLGVRDLIQLGLCEQAVARVNQSGTVCQLADWRVLRPERQMQQEKNWMPLVMGDKLHFIYLCDPTRIVDHEGRTVVEAPPLVAADDFRGGSQAILFDGGHIFLVHEVSLLNGQRVYQHRFVWFDRSFALRRLSRRFFLLQKGVEFVAGLAWHPDGKRLLVSFGVRDREAWIATIDADEVRRVLDDADGLPSSAAGIADRAAPGGSLEREMILIRSESPSEVQALSSLCQYFWDRGKLSSESP